MSCLPADFVTRIRELYGDHGEDWLRDLPALLDRCESRFCVRVQAPFPTLSYNLILAAQRVDGTAVVLKVSVLKQELSREIHALNAYAGRGAIHLIDADEDLGALVLERAEPGTPLSAVEDDHLATEIFCDVFQRLHVTSDTGSYMSITEHFLAIDRYCRRVGETSGMNPIPFYWVERAGACLADLDASTQEQVLLHGDLHHDNILRHTAKGWVVIDPKGILGDPHFDVIQYLLNYEHRGGDVHSVLRRRIGIISDCLSLDPRRIAMWGIARGVLEACWAIEDGRVDWEKGVRISERFASLL